MSMVITRSPLLQIEMNGAGTSKRRSARLSQEALGENGDQAAAKRGQSSGNSSSAAVATKMHDGANTATATTNGGSGAGSGRGRKRKPDYIEDDDGFNFKRKTRSKKGETASAAPVSAPAAVSKAEAAPPSETQSRPKAKAEAITEEQQPPKTAQKRPRRQLPSTPEHKAAGKSAKRSKRTSTEHEIRTTASPHRLAHARSHAVAEGRSPSPSGARPVTVEKRRKTTGEDGRIEEEKIIRIALPFADTPIIRRNREMRKASADKTTGRRSSGSLRGRRASSLIDEGRGSGKSGLVTPTGVCATPNPPAMAAEEPTVTALEIVPSIEHENARRQMESNCLPRPNARDTPFIKQENDVATSQNPFANDIFKSALPHTEVPTSELYKHIAEELTEPRRMRCLLGWCGSRALPPQTNPPPDTASDLDTESKVTQAARAIQEELSQELITNGLLSDWFSRDDQAPPKKRKKKPNPRNVANLAKAGELERELENLKQERTAWTQLIKTSEQQAQFTDPVEGNEQDGGLSPLHPELLDSPQRALLDKLELQQTTDLAEPPRVDPGDIQIRLKSFVDNLEFSIDSFAAGVHQLTTTAGVADRLAERTLGSAAGTIEQQEASRREGGNRAAGVLESMRGLARVLNQQPSSSSSSRAPQRR